MMWRLPRDAAQSFEYVDFPWKCPPSEGEIHKALTAQYRSTYRCDFTSMPQGRTSLLAEPWVYESMSEQLNSEQACLNQTISITFLSTAYFLFCCGTRLAGDDHDNNPERRLASKPRRKVPPSTDTEMRDNYRQPKKKPELLHCSMNPKVVCRGIGTESLK